MRCERGVFWCIPREGGVVCMCEEMTQDTRDSHPSLQCDVQQGCVVVATAENKAETHRMRHNSQRE
jgi:hypothetical protein